MTTRGTRVLRLGARSVILRPRTVVICLLLAALGAVLAVALLGSGTMRLSPQQVYDSLTGTATGSTAERIARRIRLPRVLTGALVGMALGMAGAVFQSVSRNVLGSPDVIGFTTGAATGAITQIIVFNAGPAQTAIAAIASGLVTAAVVMALARGQGGGGGYRLVLVGIGVGAVLSGLNTLLMVKGDLERAASAQLWLAGSLNARSWAHVVPVAVGVLICAPLLAALGRKLAMLEMGDDLACALGVRPGRVRFGAVLLAVGLTSVATAAAGPIAFIALAGPQIARRLTRAPGVPLVSAGLCGAVLLMTADLAGQRAPVDMHLPIGLTTGLLGGAYLIHVLLRSNRRG